MNSIGSDSRLEEDMALLKITDPSKIVVAPSYKGPHLSFPLSSNQVQAMVDAFKQKQVNEDVREVNVSG